jgi:hypothetical protein
MSDYSKQLSIIIGKTGRLVNSLIEYYNNTKDFPRASDIKTLKSYFDEVSSLYKDRDFQIDSLQSANDKLKEELNGHHASKIELVRSNLNLTQINEEQILFMQRIIFVYPQILDRVSNEELKRLFGDKVINQIKNNKYNAYKKVA